MAKAKKGGLGRGLNSLLGPEVEASTTPNTDAVPTQKSEPAKEADPILKTKDNKTEITETDSLSVKANASASAAQVTQEDREPKIVETPAVDEISEEKVTIKGVVERPARADDKDKSDAKTTRPRRLSLQTAARFLLTRLNLIQNNPAPTSTKKN